MRALAFWTLPFLAHPGFRVTINASERPALPVTLSLFPGHREDNPGVDDILQLSLAPPQADRYDQEDVDTVIQSTGLCLGNPSVSVIDGRNIPYDFSGAQVSPVPVLPSAATRAGYSPVHRRPSIIPGHPAATEQDSPYPPKPAKDPWTFCMLPVGAGEKNLRTMPPHAQEGHMMNTPTWSGSTEILPFQPQINPSDRYSRELQLAAQESPKRPENVQSSLASGAHDQRQPAKKVKIGRLAPGRAVVQSSSAEPATNSSPTDGGERILSISSPTGWQFQHALAHPSPIGNDGAVSHVSLDSVVARAPQRVTKATKILKFDADVFSPQNSPAYAIKLDQILSLIKSFEEVEQKEFSLGHFKLLNKKLDDYVHGKNRHGKTQGSEMTRDQLQSFSLEQLHLNEHLWFRFWEERTGIKFKEIVDSCSRHNLNKNYYIKRNFTLFLFYVDMIGTILGKYYSDGSDKAGDPSTILLKKAVELADPTIENKSFLHRFEEDPHQGKIKNFLKPFVLNWKWISTLIIESGHRNLQQLFFPRGTGNMIPYHTRAYFNDIFFYSIITLNERLKMKFSLQSKNV